VGLKGDGQSLIRLEGGEGSGGGGDPVAALGALDRTGSVTQGVAERIAHIVARGEEESLAGPPDRERLTAGDHLHPGDEGGGLAIRCLRQEDLDRALKGVLGVVDTEGESARRPAQVRFRRVEHDQRAGRPAVALDGAIRFHTGDNPASARGASCIPAAGRSRTLPVEMSTCVVTGGAGFLGSHLCDRLLAKGHRVICIDNLDTGSLQNIQHISDAQFTFLNQDLTEPVFLDDEVDFVYHLASPASPIDYARLPLHTLKVGSYGTHHMLGLAKFKRARFLLASTSEVYGDPQIHPQHEDYWGHVNPIGPRGVYDEAKRYAEALSMAYHRQQGVNTCIARIHNTFGPKMRPHDGRAIPTFLRQALQDKPVTVFGDGSQTRSFCYVDDLISGLVLLAESDFHLPVNLGNPDEMALIDLAKTVIEVTESRSEIVFEALPVDDPHVRQPDITRARHVLGWEPQVELRDGLQRTIEQAGVERLVGATD